MTTVSKPAIDAPKQPERKKVEYQKLDVSHFDQLPDGAVVSVRVFCAVSGMALSTAWRHVQNATPGFPVVVRLSEKCTRMNVGSIRAYLAGKFEPVTKPPIVGKFGRHAAQLQAQPEAVE